MKSKSLLNSTLLLLWTLNFQLSNAHAQGTAFTYQGRLNANGAPANGFYDFRFRIAADSNGNNFIGSSILTSNVPVANGLFLATLDFGPDIFTGSNAWFQIEVKTNGAATYATLNPLEQITPSPYAIFANTSSNLSGTLPASQLSGTVPVSALAGTYSNAVILNNAGNSFTGNGSGLSGVNAATVGGMAAINFWNTAGNNGT